MNWPSFFLNVLGFVLLLGVLAWLGLPWWLAVLLVLLAPWWLGPVAVRVSTRHPAEPRFEPYAPGPHQVPGWALEFLDRATAGLTALGFTGGPRFVESTWVRNLTSVVTLLDAPDGRCVAMPAAIYMAGSGAGRRVAYVEFTSRLSDGRRLLTNNSPILSVFPDVPGKSVIHLGQVDDPARLYRIHHTLVERALPAAAEPVPREGDQAARLARAMVQGVQEQLRTGYMRFDAEAREYRPTWKGAVLMSWKLLPPWRQTRMGLRTARLLEELHV